MQNQKRRSLRALDVLGTSLALLLVGAGVSITLIGVGVDTAAVLWFAALYAGAVVGSTAAAAIVATRTIQLKWELPRLRRPRRLRLPAIRQLPLHQVRLWWRDYGRWFLLLIPLGLAAFLAYYFWPWGLAPALLFLLLVGVSAVSAHRTRQVLSKRMVIRWEKPHPIAFLAYGWEWGRKLGWAHLWPLMYLTLAGLATEAASWFAPKTLAHLPWWAIAVVVGGFVFSTSFWWWFWSVAWPGYWALIITDKTLAVVRPAPGPLLTVRPEIAEINIMDVTTWNTTQGFFAGTWDPGGLMFGMGEKERVAATWLRNAEESCGAASEQRERILQQRQQQKQR